MHSVALRTVSLAPGQELGPLRARDVVRLLRDALPVGRARGDGGADGRARPAPLSPTTVAAYVLRTLERFMHSADDALRADVHVPRNMAEATDLAPGAVAAAAAALWDMIVAGRTRAGRSVPCPHDAYVKLLHLGRGDARVFAEYNVLLLDEAQDLSACQTAILLRARGQCGVVVVGDVHQKIYGFRGGTATAFNARLYPPSATFALTRSFRFGPQIAALATDLLGLKAPPPWLRAAAYRRPRLSGSAPDAVYRTGKAPMPHTRIYRTNAQLAKDALRLATVLAAHVRVFLKTSQSLARASLMALFRDAHRLFHGMGAADRASPLRDFASWKELVEHVEAEEGGGDGKLGLVVSLAPALAAGDDFLDRVARLDARFAERECDAALVLTTVHQAKGLEWDRVVLADDFSPALDAVPPALRPQITRYAQQDELNHLYVALTRARRELAVPPGVTAWLVALRGLFRYRFSARRTTCPRCGARRVCLVELCSWLPAAPPAEKRSRPRRARRAAPDATPLGCLACVRAQLDDDDLADFVRWIAASGVSMATGRVSAAALARLSRAPQRKRKREAPPHACAAATLSPDERALRYAALTESYRERIAAWIQAEAVARSGAPQP